MLKLLHKTAVAMKPCVTPEGQTDDAAEPQDEILTPPQRRHHGLYNQGATCYLNSVLQVLFMTTEFNDRLDPEKQTDLQLREIFEGLKETTCGTENITTTFGIKNVYQQCDAFVCLEKILHQVSTKASKVFQGHLRDTTKCCKGHIINEETNPFWTLPLSLEDGHYSTYSVENSLGHFSQEQTNTGDNRVYCNDCNHKTGTTSVCEMVKAPQILILRLKRFYITSLVKSDCCVEVPCELQLKDKTYKLYGMVNHMGSLRGGRYTATVLSEDNTWYECDDSHVSKVKHQLVAKDRTFSSSTVYLLTYRATECSQLEELKPDYVEQALNHQPGGEKGNGTASEVKSSEDEDARGDSSSDKEGLKDSSEKHLEKDTKKEEQRSRFRILFDDAANWISDKLKIIPDDGESTQMGHSAEDEGQVTEDRNEERLQARGEEGDVENVVTDTKRKEIRKEQKRKKKEKERKKERKGKERKGKK